MTKILPKIDMSIISHFIGEEMGLFFPENKWVELERGLKRACHAFHYQDLNTCVQWLMSSHLNQEKTEILASCLTVGETYFYRDTKIFETIEKDKLIPLIYERYKSNRQLRIWSAGCSTGEEPLSIAMTLNRLIPDIKNWNVHLIASDINTQALEKMSKGVYSQWSFRNVSPSIQSSYFKEIGPGQFEVLPSIKSMIKTFYLNLSQDVYPSLLNDTNAMDIILCRNVLMYFSEEKIRKIIKRFYHTLSDGGWLVVGCTECYDEYYSDFVSVRINGMTFYQKKIESLKSNVTDPPIQRKKIVIQPESHSKELNDIETIENYANAGRLNDALKKCDECIEQYKSQTEFYYLKAMILIELGQDDLAMQTLKSVIYLNQKHIMAYINLGSIAKRQGRINDSNEYCQCALSLLQQLNPESVIEGSGGVTANKMIDMVGIMSNAR